MNRLKFQVNQLWRELERKDLSKQRLMEIKEATRDIALQIDTMSNVSCVVGMVDEIYRVETKYPKRRIKKVVQLLMEAVNV